jgi:hypothetical protein
MIDIGHMIGRIGGGRIDHTAPFGAGGLGIASERVGAPRVWSAMQIPYAVSRTRRMYGS